MAIINNTNNFIFIHIPKCAGTTVGTLLSQYTKIGDIELGVTEFGQALSPLYFKRFGIRKHSQAEEIRNVLGDQKWNQFYSFSFVRQPFNKLISAYSFLKYSWRGWSGSDIMDSFDSFEEFVMSDFFLTPGPDRIFAPQFRFCYDSNDQCILDFIGKVERLDEDLNSLLNNLKLSSDKIRIGKHNVTEKKKQNEKISSYCMARLIKRYGIDFKLLNYEIPQQWD